MTNTAHLKAGVALLFGSMLLLISGSCRDQFETRDPITTVAGSDETASFRGGFNWPQWRGPQRDGVSREAGLIKKWSENGPTEIWRRPIGTGYSGVVVSDGSLFTLEQKQGESLLALNAETGEEKWSLSLSRGFSSGQGDGPRGTPAVDGNLIFAVGGGGVLAAADRTSGVLMWKHHLGRELGGTKPYWGFSTSPLVEGEIVFVEPGGGKGSLAGFRKNDGHLLWRSQGDPVGYSSPLAVPFEGTRQILFFTARHLLSLNRDGRLLWKLPWTTSYDVNAATPVWIPPNRIFISSNYDVGGAVYEMHSLGPPRLVWGNRQMRNHFNSSIYLSGYLYGFDNATLKCIDAADGSMKWRARGLGKGSLIAADSLLIILGERGQLVLAEATPEAYRELSRAQVLSGKCWTSPTLAHGKLYLRNQTEILCIEMRR